MEMEKETQRKFTPRRSALVTLVLLVAVGVVFSLFSLALSAWEGISWGGNPELFLWNALPVLLLLGLLWLATGQAWLACLVVGALLFLLTGGTISSSSSAASPCCGRTCTTSGRAWACPTSTMWPSPP